ncbi:NAD(P)/FAD-dependent oxidoreductase [Hymenobacter busanensis]|uniref:NADH:ubiquinone reductase (non-electrogenic) n=1 Tax=Hymenobacter busanensis TaxID=2607656 RepID=A0A7L4ZXL4_9BACT|nr:NAD(P)/FAD-dependent oxidoreductase [Hymenobacter busanensis]KAA9325354.1 NAD(P)/FAD-dependent oxidoreductase [Hymenobacter busanensis]QHJ07653.1 FAD-dependent oxidoreductase [Hymenobacter busanensis]
MDTNLPKSSHPRLVIIGCGFAGLRLAKALKHDPVQVVVIDRNNYHNFQPLLYQVATGALEADSIAYPIRKIFAGQKNFFYRMADVQRVDTAANTVHTNIGDIHYDYLVLATGSLTNFFGIESIEKNAMQIKSIPNALNLRSYIFQNFEKALLTEDPVQRQALMNIVVVGGGPTGVEISGSLAEMRKHVLPKDYPELDLQQMQIYIVEAGAELLGPMSPQSQRDAFEYLKELGVNIRLNTSIKRYEDCKAYYSETEFIPTENLIWAAGVNGAAVPGLPDAVVARNKRITVNRWNQVEGFTNVFAIGDVANMVTEDMPKGLPMLAPVAIQQADHLAENFRRLAKGQTPVDFKYHNKGVMAIVARNKAVVDLPKGHFRGFLGWLTWLFVHLMTLVGFRNKVVALTDWAFSYFSSDQALRLIIRPFSRRDVKDDKGKKTAEHQASTPQYNPTPPAIQTPAA